MIKLSNLKISAKAGEEKLLQTLAQKTGAKGIKNLQILKKSVDARKKTDVNLIYSVAFSADNENINLATKIIFLNGFIKKSTKDYDSEIPKALKMLRDLL